MSTRWEAFAFDRVRADDLRAGLAARGIAWDEVGHVSATRSLATAIGELGAPSVRIGTLIDLLLLPGLPGDWRLELEGFAPYDPAQSESERAQARQPWRHEALGRSIRLRVQLDDCLRRWAKESGGGGGEASALIHGRRAFGQTLQQLIAAGVSPHDVTPTGRLEAAAVEVWQRAEEEIPPLSAPRSDLWIPSAEIEAQTPRSMDLRDRLHAALDRAFGPTQGRRTLIHHGFFFFLPPQWALFRLLRDLGDVDQVFIVHDDGDNPVFESWRRFFEPSLDMPVPQRLPGDGARTRQAAALRSALDGSAVDGSAAGIRIVTAKNGAELVRQIRQARSEARDRGVDTPRLYGADGRELSRFVRRLSGTSLTETTDLAQLPVGTFLLGLHHSISTDGSIRLAPERFLDIAATGLLPLLQMAPGSKALAALRRALLFFEDCERPDEWRRRADELVELVEVHVPIAGGRATDGDLARMSSLAANPLLRLPWADIGVDDAKVIRTAIRQALRLVEEIAATERVTMRRHLDRLRHRLRDAMAELPDELREQVEAQLRGLSSGLDDEVDVQGIIDAVHMLLGREVATDLTGEDDDSETAISELWNLDALGLVAATSDVHVANLSDRRFPKRVAGIGWPFTGVALQRTEAARNAASLLDLRASTSPLGDLYLLWLALDGVEGGAKVVLGHIEDLAGEPQNPSGVLALLAEARSLPEAIRDAIGGVEVESVPPAAHATALRRAPEVASPTQTDSAIAALGRVDPRAAASASACARRFALQWLLGPTAAARGSHHHVMLAGNVRAALQSGVRLSAVEAERASQLAFAPLADSERLSSEIKRVVTDGSGPGARAEWVLTLAGSKDRQDPLSLAYRAAIAGRGVQIQEDRLGAGVLPPGVDDETVCRHCPVRERCLDEKIDRS